MVVWWWFVVVLPTNDEEDYAMARESSFSKVDFTESRKKRTGNQLLLLSLWTGERKEVITD